MSFHHLGCTKKAVFPQVENLIFQQLDKFPSVFASADLGWSVWFLPHSRTLLQDCIVLVGQNLVCCKGIFKRSYNEYNKCKSLQSCF